MTPKSWVIVNKKSGKPVLETYNKLLLKSINLEKYQIYTSLDWLVHFNKLVKSGKA